MTQQDVRNPETAACWFCSATLEPGKGWKQRRGWRCDDIPGCSTRKSALVTHRNAPQPDELAELKSRLVKAEGEIASLRGRHLCPAIVTSDADRAMAAEVAAFSKHADQLAIKLAQYYEATGTKASRIRAMLALLAAIGTDRLRKADFTEPISALYCTLNGRTLEASS